MSTPSAPAPSAPTKRSRDEDLLGVLSIVGGLAGILVIYLVLDWLKTRREASKLARRRHQAREAWQRELEESKKPEPPPNLSS
jgi:hypothetical protein